MWTLGELLNTSLPHPSWKMGNIGTCKEGTVKGPKGPFLWSLRVTEASRIRNEAGKGRQGESSHFKMR